MQIKAILRNWTCECLFEKKTGLVWTRLHISSLFSVSNSLPIFHTFFQKPQFPNLYIVCFTFPALNISRKCNTEKIQCKLIHWVVQKLRILSISIIHIGYPGLYRWRICKIRRSIADKNMNSMHFSNYWWKHFLEIVK